MKADENKGCFCPLLVLGLYWKLPAPKARKKLRGRTQPADATVPAAAWQSSPSHLQAPCIALSCPPFPLPPSCPCLLQTSLLPLSPPPSLPNPPHPSLPRFPPALCSPQPFVSLWFRFLARPRFTLHICFTPIQRPSSAPASPPRPSTLQLIAELRSPRTSRPFGSPPRTFVLRSPPCPLAPVPRDPTARARPSPSLPPSLLGAPPGPPRSAQAGPGGAICRGGDEEGPLPPARPGLRPRRRQVAASPWQPAGPRAAGGNPLPRAGPGGSASRREGGGRWGRPRGARGPARTGPRGSAGSPRSSYGPSGSVPQTEGAGPKGERRVRRGGRPRAGRSAT